MITRPGVYRMPLEEYVRDPAPSPSLNHGAAHTILTHSPLHAWNRHPRLAPDHLPDDSARADIGTAAHAILLEGDRSRIAVVEADDWKTKAARQCQAEAREQGLVPVLACKMADIEAMVRAAEATIARSEMANLFTKDGGMSEQTLIWQELNGVWCRTRPDRASTDWRLIVDYKTASNAHPDAWGRGPLVGQGYDLQAALAMRAVMQLDLAPSCTFIYLVQEIEPPYVCSIIGLSPRYLAMAERRRQEAVRVWGECLAAGRWPGYPTRVAYLDMPTYVEAQWDEKLSPTAAVNQGVTI